MERVESTIISNRVGATGHNGSSGQYGRSATHLNAVVGVERMVNIRPEYVKNTIRLTNAIVEEAQ